MILVDASVIIDFWRAPTTVADEILSRADVCICGITLAELMYGALDEDDSVRIRMKLKRYVQLAIQEEDWPFLGQNLCRLRRIGLRVPFPDAMLATLAVQHDMELWSLDAHFVQIQKAIPSLKLFQTGAPGR